MSQVKLVMVEPQPSLGILGILREAFKITIRNGKLMVSTLLPEFLSLSLLSLGAHLAFAPLLGDLTSKVALLNKDHKISEVDETLRKVSSSSDAYNGKN
ncbi:hypothetical protein F0562_009217 [Nyssa sinensis]|uniref:Uncharacterized protein n=1 Tax=Nyssa sinensis TaxID=561372 RepID=A0A5J4ZXZ8_9ASTE|nr:hypothetical protein F0562_009217 [Nyssa sinensis]